MRRLIGMAAGLAARDWAHERQIALCAVLALASMLAPLLVLQGVRNGVTEGMRERLLQDPAVLVITPSGSREGGYDTAFLETLGRLPGARFVIGRTRDIATDITLRSSGGSSVTVQMEPCAPGEPVLEHYRMPAPADGEQPELVLSQPAARQLNVRAGDTVSATLGRRTPEGRLESTELPFRVSGILPEEAAGRRMGFLPLRTLEDIQDYRDSIAVPERGYAGRPRTAEARRYASFRLYAQHLDAVETLAAALRERHVETRTKAREIAGIRALEQAVSRVILSISLAVGAGFAAFTFSSAQGAVRRKDRMLGMLRLLGFPRAALIAYPLMQTLLTGLCGIALSGLLYLCIALGIDLLFAEQSGGASFCRLYWQEYAAAAGMVLLLSALAAARASAQAAAIEPSSVIREV
ncbi:MAG: ABC transporter permease [Desulfovibrionaceae bacterium]